MQSERPLIDYVNRILVCETIEDVWALHVAKMTEFGFDRLLYGSTRAVTDGLFGNFADGFVLSNYDKGFVDALFGERKLFLHVPKNDWASREIGAFNWRIFEEWMNRGALTTEEQAVLELYREHQVRAGYSIRFPKIDIRSAAGIGLCARAGLSHDEVDEIWAQDGEEIMMLNGIMHLKVSTLPQTGRHHALTDRQREVLEWSADGKTVQDISLILGLSPATIEKHLRLARSVLGVETTAQAVKKAADMNQLYPLNAMADHVAKMNG